MHISRGLHNEPITNSVGSHLHKRPRAAARPLSTGQAPTRLECTNGPPLPVCAQFPFDFLLAASCRPTFARMQLQSKASPHPVSASATAAYQPPGWPVSRRHATWALPTARIVGKHGLTARHLFRALRARPARTRLIMALGLASQKPRPCVSLRRNVAARWVPATLDRKPLSAVDDIPTSPAGGDVHGAVAPRRRDVFMSCFFCLAQQCRPPFPQTVMSESTAAGRAAAG